MLFSLQATKGCQPCEHKSYDKTAAGSACRLLGEGNEGEELLEQKPDDKKCLKRKRSSLGTRVKISTLPNETVAEIFLESHQSSCPAVLIEPPWLEAMPILDSLDYCHRVFGTVFLLTSCRSGPTPRRSRIRMAEAFSSWDNNQSCP